METDADNPFTAILSAGETMLWMGQPDKTSYLKGQRRQFKRIIFWILAFLGFVCLLPELGLGLKPVHWQFAVTDLVLVAICAWIFYCEHRKNEVPDWHFAVTNQRVLFQYPGEDESLLKQFSMGQIKKVQLRTYPGGPSTVIFVPIFFAPTGLAFRFVAEAAEVQALVISLLPGAQEIASRASPK